MQKLVEEGLHSKCGQCRTKKDRALLSCLDQMCIRDRERIIRLADEIVMVSGGRILEQGPVSEIFPKILANTTGECSYMEGN